MFKIINLIIFSLLFIFFLFFIVISIPQSKFITPKIPIFLKIKLIPERFIFLGFPFITSKQSPLQNPPKTIKGVYLTSFSAGNYSRIAYILQLAREKKINSVVIDVKDYSGYIAYNSSVPEVKQYKTSQIRIRNLSALISIFHRAKIYTIARITCFQDPLLAQKRPDLAIKTKEGKVFKDNKGLAWLDPSSIEVWNYLLSIAKEVSNYGFDEINFDYVRFPSDNNVSNLIYPFYDGKMYKHKVIKNFYSYLKKNLKGIRISVDLFGQTMIDKGDVGIGQKLEDAFPYFNYICPMLYPSHFHTGFLGYKNPAKYPYEVINYSLKEGLKRLKKFKSRSNKYKSLNVHFRPWLQDFSLKTIYGLQEVKEQIKALNDNGVKDWTLWNPRNEYHLSPVFKSSF